MATRWLLRKPWSWRTTPRRISRRPRARRVKAAPRRPRRAITGVTIVSAGTYAVTLPWALGDYDDGRSHGVLHVATAVGLPLSAYIVAAAVYFATTIPYSSDFFCDG